ncbi:MAG: leucine-rich repeat domain-containing protein [Candidatus Thorarchaeota archaeon]
MSVSVGKNLKDIEVIKGIKRLIKLRIAQSMINSEFKITEKSNEYIGYVIDEDGKAITLEINNLKYFNLDNYNLSILNNEIQETISNLNNLKELKLSGNNISQIIPDLKKLENLELLNLSDNKIEHFSKDIITSKNLRTINLSNNSLLELPEISVQLNLLEQIDLSNNNFSKIPNINNFARNLKILNLSSNKIQSVGNPINRMEKIEEIYLGKNLIKTIERNVFNNTLLLRIIDLSNNYLREINFDFSPLNNLKRFYLYGNPISKHRNIYTIIQKIIKNRNFKNIIKDEKLVLAYFEILINESELIYEIEGSNITKLKLPFQDISQLPENIGYLTELRVLDIKGNKLKSLPKSFEKLTKLETLDLSLNYGINLPNDFSIYSKLKDLNIGSCNLPKILDSLVELKNLKNLNISGNRITSIHPKIGNLEYLEKLDLSYNVLEEIQLPLLELKSLKHLNLAGNKIHEIPDDISTLRNLEVLNLNFNQVQNLVIGLSFLNKLKKLFLIQNRLNEIPSYIFELKSLKVAHFTANNISIMQCDINIFEKFDEFYISENPLPIHLRYKYFTGKYDKKIILKELKINNFYSFKDCVFTELSQMSLLVGTNNSGKSNFFKIIEKIKPFSRINTDIINTNASYDEASLLYIFKLSDEMINYIIENIKIYSNKSRFIDFKNLMIINNELIVNLYDFLRNLHLRSKLFRSGTQYLNYIDLFGFFSEGNSINLIQYSDQGNYQSNIQLLNPNWKNIAINHSYNEIDFTWDSNVNHYNADSNMLKNQLFDSKNIEKFDFTLFIYSELIEYFIKSQKIIEHRNFESEFPLSLAHDSIINESGYNFPNIVELFIHYKLELHSILNSLINEFYPEIHQIWSESERENSDSRISIKCKPFIMEFNEKRYFENLGKGIHQILIILTHLLQLGENYTLMIEEPELFIHPHLQKILYNIIQRFLPFHQIFITTHSPFIIDSYDKNSSIHQIVKLNDESTVKSIVKRNIPYIIQELGVRPSDIIMNDGFLLVEGERDIRLFHRLFRELVKEKHIELIPFHGKHNLHFYADHKIISTLIDRGFKFRIILDNDEGNQRIYEDISDPKVKEHIVLLPVREIENLYLNPLLFEKYLKIYHEKNFEGENITEFITVILTEAISEEMIWNCKIKSLINEIKFRFSKEEIKKLLKSSTSEELLDKLDSLIQQKYQVNGIDKQYYKAKFIEISNKIDNEEEKWKIIDGKKLRATVLKKIKDRTGITVNFEIIERLMKKNNFVLKNLINPIESFFNAI